jgi:arabinose-5-phosphate isomerase
MLLAEKPQIDAIALAREVLQTEADSILALQQRLGAEFEQAIETILHCQGRLVVIGMGKSGHIGKKIAATLASTGTPAFFVHPGEASHGDMGMITSQDVALCLSNSGKTDEVLSLLPFLKRLRIPLIAMTGDKQSTLAQAANTHLDVSVEAEACPLGLAPTASTTATLAMGDALAVALLAKRGFSSEDFAFSHPAGALGRRLLLKVADIMHGEDRLPKITAEALLSEALLEISAKGLGLTLIVDAHDNIQGIFTDGDLRRALNQEVDVRQAKIVDYMTSSCCTITPDTLAAEALNTMEAKKITALPVVDTNNKLIGIVHIHSLLQAGVI